MRNKTYSKEKKEAAYGSLFKGVKMLVAFCAVAVALVLLGTLTFAATSLNTGITGLTASYEGDASWTSSGGAITGTVSAKVSSGCTGDTFDAQSGTLTFTNSSSGTRAFTFVYTVELNQGTASIDGTSVTVGGTFSKKLEAGDTVAIALTSNAVDSKSTSIAINNISFVEERDVSVTFKAPVNGSYTVNGEVITADTVKTVKTTDQIQLSATAASGFKILSWNNETDGVFFSTAASLTTSFADDCTVSAEFVESSTPVFKVGDSLFTALSDAVALAVSGSEKTVVLISSGTLPAGNYTISNGVTLLIPYSGAYGVVKETPNIVFNAYTTPSRFMELTIASNASITVANGGAISVAGQLSSKGQLAGWNGTPTGPDGRIKMNSNSSITLNSGAKLYCWGYIYGSGSVVAESGSTVHEAFQIKDWRGGSATSNIVDYAFIFNQYYIQNIEVPLTMYAGATEILYSAVNAPNVASHAFPTSAGFIGSSACLFNVTSGYIIKDYIESSDRLRVDVYGDISVSPMTLSGLPLIGSISTESYILPITSNLTINIHSGTTTVLQNIELLPGVELKIDSGAEFIVSGGKSVYVYDNDDWGNFTGSARLYVIGYSAANGTTAKRTAASLVDALIDVNGILTVSGNLYTTVGGANITSSEGTGTVVLSSAPSAVDTTIYEMSNNSDKTAVTCNPARLHNGANRPSDVDEYVATAGNAAGTSYFYCHACDIWLDASVAHTHTVTWIIEGVSETQDVAYGTIPVYGGEEPSKPATDQYTYTFAGWALTQHGEVLESIPAVTGDATYYAVFTAVPVTYTVTWVNFDGTPLLTEEYALGAVPDFTGDTPLKASDANFNYVFAGWFPAPDEVTGPVIYTAEFAGYDTAASTDATDFQLSARTLYLHNDLSIVYKVNASTLTAGGYTDPYLICTINNKPVRLDGVLVTETVATTSGTQQIERYIFEFKNINPQQMATSVFTFVYSTKDGSLYRSAMTSYSVRKYAENQLAKASTPAILRTLLVDLLNYGADAQLYTEHRMIDLANSTLSAEQLGYATAEVPELTSVAGQGPEIESPSVAWNAVTLMLDNAVQIRLKVECADISGVKASVVTDYGRTFEITSDKLVPVGSSEPNRYFLFINELNFARLRNKYDITFVNDAGTPVSRTFSYSVASYAAGKINGTTTEAALLRSLMKFGASAEAYVASLSN
ncbi:MAG: hypothetical protein J6T65_06460 [Clostridia bacterium]|nr:hypothetical protein [Clostridia bacterium]